MSLFRNKYRIESARMPGWDYSSPGHYYITSCVHGRRCVLGECVDERIDLSPLGRLVDRQWLMIPAHFPSVDLDYYQIMPNHFHGIVCITSRPGAAAFPRPTLGQIVAWFKYHCTMRINEYAGKAPGTRFWQTRFHDRVIRNRRELERIRRYILLNPLTWERDPHNPRHPRPTKGNPGKGKHAA